jgi:cell shape-determining protein MreC
VFDDSIFLTIFSITATVLIAVVVAVFWLARERFQLKRDWQILSSIVDGSKNDIFGLCSAALVVDEKNALMNEQIHDLKQQLAHLLEKINELQQSDSMNSPYNVDIRKIRDGASVEELMQQSDLSYDEAALLIRLHGAKK